MGVMVSRAVIPLLFRKHQQWLTPYLFIARNIALFTAFSFLPLIYAVYISFHDWGLIGEPSFIGIRNYLRLWQDPLFWRALANTLLYAASDRILARPAQHPLGRDPAARRRGIRHLHGSPIHGRHP